MTTTRRIRVLDLDNGDVVTDIVKDGTVTIAWTVTGGRWVTIEGPSNNGRWIKVQVAANAKLSVRR